MKRKYSKEALIFYAMLLKVFYTQGTIFIFLGQEAYFITFDSAEFFYIALI